MCTPEEFPELRDEIHSHASEAGRDPASIGTEAGVAVVGPREAEWKERVSGWREAGLSHLCLRTLGVGLGAKAHIETMRRAHEEIPGSVDG